MFFLSSQGYGTIAEIRDLDTVDFLNLLEYESILIDVQTYKDEAK